MNTEHTIAELLAIGETAETYFLGTLGYDRVDFDGFRVESSGEINWYFALYDDFQKELSLEFCVNHGYTFAIYAEKLKEADATLLEYITTMPNRAQRELQVLAKKMGSIDSDISLLVSEQAKAFVERIQPSIDDLRRQLTDQS